MKVPCRLWWIALPILANACGGGTIFKGNEGKGKSKSPSAAPSPQAPVAPAAPALPTPTVQAPPAPPAPVSPAACALAFTDETILNLTVTGSVQADKIVKKLEVRDFRAKGAAEGNGHDDFQNPLFKDKREEKTGLVKELLQKDGFGNKVPVYAGESGSDQRITSAASFAEWFSTSDKAKLEEFEVTLTRQGDKYVYQSNDFFPVKQGWGVEAGTGWDPPAKPGRNYHFTTVMRTQFYYRGGESFTFVGDDDVWVFINDRLAVDLGGTHIEKSKSVNLDEKASALQIERGKQYSLDVFHAERYTENSNYRIETTIKPQDAQAFEHMVKLTCGVGKLRYEIKDAPSGMTISDNGLVEWKPSGVDKDATFTYKVIATDERGGSGASKTYTINLKKTP